MNSPTIGSYLVLGFGNGSQLAYVSGIARTGALQIQRCQAWRGTDKYCAPHWTCTLSNIKPTDNRIQKVLSTLPSGLPAPYTHEYVVTAKKAASAAAKAEKAIRDAVDSEAIRADFTSIYEAAKVCSCPSNNTWGEHSEGCQVPVRMAVRDEAAAAVGKRAQAAWRTTAAAVWAKSGLDTDESKNLVTA